MSRFLIPSLAAAVLTVAAAGMAAAGEKSTCERGAGKAVCCKAYVANHCGPFSATCCEKGNAAFFTAKKCGGCESQAKVAAHQAKHGCAASAGCEKSAAKK